MKQVYGRAWIRRAGAILIVDIFAYVFDANTRAGHHVDRSPLRDGGGLERGLNTRLTTALPAS